MLKRYFSLFNLKVLFGVLVFLYIGTLSSTVLNGVFENIVGMIFFTFLVFLSNTSATTNLKWVRTGVYTDKTDEILTNAGKRLKAARLGKINPLFISVGGKYYYHNDKYK